MFTTNLWLWAEGLVSQHWLLWSKYYVNFCIDNFLLFSGVTTFGKNAVVCGRSKNVGMPIAMLLHADGKGWFESWSCFVNIV